MDCRLRSSLLRGDRQLRRVHDRRSTAGYVHRESVAGTIERTCRTARYGRGGWYRTARSLAGATLADRPPSLRRAARDTAVRTCTRTTPASDTPSRALPESLRAAAARRARAR